MRMRCLFTFLHIHPFKFIIHGQFANRVKQTDRARLIKYQVINHAWCMSESYNQCC